MRDWSIRAPLRYDQAAWHALLRGAAIMASLLRPTLGPLPRSVLIRPIVGNGSPEILDHAATIARRVIELPDPFENAGAMLLRHAVWRVYERVGDGCATTAVLSAALLREVLRVAEAGWNIAQLEHVLEQVWHCVRANLLEHAKTDISFDQLHAVIQRAVYDPALARLLSEAVDAVGPEGVVLFEDGVSADPTCVYEEGIVWDSGVLSPIWLQAPDGCCRVHEPRILLLDGAVTKGVELLPFLERCLASNIRRLVIIAGEMRHDALALVVRNGERGVFEQIVALRAPSVGWQQQEILEDLAALTGGLVVHCNGGESLSASSIAVLGRARQVWATLRRFGILGGHLDRERVRARLRAARAALARADDAYLRTKAQERIARLTGVTARLQVGGILPREREARRLVAESAVKTAQAALSGGLVPGGGATLLGIARELRALPMRADPCEVAIRNAFGTALTEPIRVILTNAGIEPGRVLAEADRCPTAAFDVLRQSWVDPWQEGLLDPVQVIDAAIETAVSMVRMVLSTGALLHRTWPAVAAHP
jgi:chaperonin GroEL